MVSYDNYSGHRLNAEVCVPTSYFLMKNLQDTVENNLVSRLKFAEIIDVDT